MYDIKATIKRGVCCGKTTSQIYYRENPLKIQVVSVNPAQVEYYLDNTLSSLQEVYSTLIEPLHNKYGVNSSLNGSIFAIYEKASRV
jgi:hypothetical protein